MPLTLGPGITITGGITFTDEAAANSLYFWGLSYYGEGLLAYRSYRSSPVQVNSSTNWGKLDYSFKRNSGAQTIAAVKLDGTLWSWGWNLTGEAGQNNVVSYSSPVQVGTGTSWSKVGGGAYTTFGIKTNGTLWAWGKDGFSSYGGTLGLNTVGVPRSSPVQVGSSTDWSMVSTGTYQTLATKTDGTLWAWGQGADSGRNTPNASSSPAQVGSDTNWSMVSAAGYISLAIKTDGTLWSWGRGNAGSGALGLNNQINRSSPTQVGSLTNWSQVSASYSPVAIKTDGTLWAWGANLSGQLGLNDTVYRSSPTQIGSATNWSKVVVSGIGGTAAVKTDGTIWGWGSRYISGQLSAVAFSSPVQIGSLTSWQNIYPTYYGVLAIAP